MIPAITTKLLRAKKSKGLSFVQLGELIGQSEVLTAAIFYRQATASPTQIEQLAVALGLAEAELTELTEYPIKGLGPVVPTDPLIYRFYEIMQVYGLPLKDVIQEKFGDGIMSAIDFTLDVEKIPDPKGDRVQVTMNGKFLPYKQW
ncbi:MAG: cyanase [Pseudanabaenaceae cyanobacterium bins.68]|nr:cyanase [Pseudanabaenaceae cyanobacterium bins.68]